MARAREHGDLPGSPPGTMFEAAERYFKVPAGRLAEVTPADRSRIAKNSLQVVFSGQRAPGHPTITITDRGEGQHPSDFPDTFLSLSAKNKFNIPFVQGKFNMGSTGAVPFCGHDHNYQLILSRRHHAGNGESRLWGFTIVRRRRPGADERLSEFQYPRTSRKNRESSLQLTPNLADREWRAGTHYVWFPGSPLRILHSGENQCCFGFFPYVESTAISNTPADPGNRIPFI